MKSFLVKDKTPIIKWGSLPDNIFFEGALPEGYSLAVCPGEYIVLDVDRHGDIDGFDNLPIEIYDELFSKHYCYKTKNNGFHVWLKYSGDKVLANKASGLGIDLRTNKGYVVYYPAKHGDDIRKHVDEIKETSEKLNKWLELLFSYK